MVLTHIFKLPRIRCAIVTCALRPSKIQPSKAFSSTQLLRLTVTNVCCRHVLTCGRCQRARRHCGRQMDGPGQLTSEQCRWLLPALAAGILDIAKLHSHHRRLSTNTQTALAHWLSFCITDCFFSCVRYRVPVLHLN